MEVRTLLDGAVTIDPEIVQGTPVFSGTRVPIENLFEFLRAGEDLDSFFEAFPRVSPIHVQRVLQESETQTMSTLLKQAA